MIETRRFIFWLSAACAVASFAFITCAARAADAAVPHHHSSGPAASAMPAGAFTASNAKPFSGLMDEAMARMSDGMASAPMTGDVDHDFAAMMIPHHQGAVDMAKAQLLYGKNPVLRRLAQEIIVTQGSEIAVMRAELDKTAVDRKQSAARP